MFLKINLQAIWQTALIEIAQIKHSEHTSVGVTRIVVEDLADDIIFLLEGKIHFQGSKNELISNTGGVNLERSIAKILENANERITPQTELSFFE